MSAPTIGYCPASAQTILNRCGTVLALRLPDARSADYFSWRFGDTEYWDKRDPEGESSEVPWSLAPRCGRLLLASDFLLLEERAGYLLMPGRQPLRVVIPEAESPRSPEAPRFLPRTELTLELTPLNDGPSPAPALNLGEEPPRACPTLPFRPRPERPFAGKLDF